MSNGPIWPIHRTPSGPTTQGQSGVCSNGNVGVLHISQSSSITETSASNCLVSYLWHSLVGSYPSAEMQSVYSIFPADWARSYFGVCKLLNLSICITYQCLKLLNYEQKMSSGSFKNKVTSNFFVTKHTHTHTQLHLHIFIYIVYGYH